MSILPPTVRICTVAVVGVLTQCTRTSRWFTAATVVVSVLCAALLAACGGGEEIAAVGATSGGKALDAASSAAWVQLEGCVVDQYYLPRSGSAIQVRSADGRLIGEATSGQHGVFILRVPARQTMSVRLGQAGDEALTIPVGGIDVSVGACLQHRRD